jgi:hypothetical protein
VPQRQDAHGGLSLEHADPDRQYRSPRHLGEGDPESPSRHDAARRHAAAGRAALDGFVSYLETSIDNAAAATPRPGRTALHRLNRAEYANAIRDLLALEIDATALLPPDDESSGFDNIADVLTVSPSLMERYLSASWNISRMALGNTALTPSTATYRVRPDLSQDQHIEGLPPGTRGGMAITHTFPVDGEYVIKLRLWRNTFDLMRGMEDPHEIEIAMDGARIQSTTAGGREDFSKMAENPGTFGADLDRRLTVRLPVKAGTHTIWATTVLKSHAPRDDLIKPFLRTTVDGLDIMGDPSVDRLTIEGPFNRVGPGDTPSRRKILSCTPRRLPKKRAAPAGLRRRSRVRRIASRSTARRSMSDELLSGRPEDWRQLRARDRSGAAVHSREPRVPVPRRAGSARAGDRGTRLSPRRPGAGLAPVVLPLEQLARRETLLARERRATERAGGARAAGQAHARGPALEDARSTTSPSSGFTCAT